MGDRPAVRARVDSDSMAVARLAFTCSAERVAVAYIELRDDAYQANRALGPGVLVSGIRVRVGRNQPLEGGVLISPSEPSSAMFVDGLASDGVLGLAG